MSESPKAELLFQYSRAEDGAYSGSAELVEPGTSNSMRPPLYVVVTRPEWVSFVVNTIRHHDVDGVSFALTRPDNTKTRYRLDPRTVEKIKDATLEADDLIL
jgi:hypothetical protein